MKKILILILFLISLNCFSQTEKKSIRIVELVSKMINKNVTFVSWYEENDTIKITQFTTYDKSNKTYKHFYSEEIKKYYPTLLELLTTKVQSPFSSPYRSDVDNVDSIQSLNLRYRPNFARVAKSNR